MSSPPQEAAPLAVTAEYSRAAQPEKNAAYNPWETIKELFPQTYSDRTGQTALRHLQKQIGWFAPEAKISLKIKSPNRDDILIHLDLTIAGLIAELLGEQADLIPTRSGLTLRARMKKTTPAVNDTNHSHREGSTETTDH